jgi:hypothetical protein
MDKNVTYDYLAWPTPYVLVQIADLGARSYGREGNTKMHVAELFPAGEKRIEKRW